MHCMIVKGINLLILIVVTLLPASGLTQELSDIALNPMDRANQAHAFKYYRMSSSPVPATEEAVPAWLASLRPMEESPAMGDIFVAAAILDNGTKQERWFINPYSPKLEEIDIYFYSQETRQLYKTGLYQTGHISLHDGAFLNIPEGTRGTLLLVYNSDFYYSNIKIRFLDSQGFTDVLESQSAIIMLSLGVMLALVVYNLFLYFASKDKVYFYLTCCITFLLLAWTNVLGLTSFLPPQLVRYLLIPPYLISAAFALQFTRKFLDLSAISKQLDSGFISLFWGYLLIMPVTAMSPGYGILITYIGGTVMVILSLIAGVVAWKRHYKPARFFIFAWLAFSLQCLAWLATFLIPALQVELSLSMIGLLSGTLGVLFLSLSLAAKVSLITVENRQLANNLEHKVYERTEALAEANVALEHLISELQEASSAKSNFLANMSHEIRTPLTSIIGYADSILLGDINRSEQERVIRVISENGNHLLHIISDILDISKIEADKLDYEMLPTKVTEIIAQVESVTGKRARDKDLAFNLNYHFPFPSEIETDPYRFKQILLNLTNNAIKFTDSGHISIDISYADEFLEVSVKDSGIGMSKEKIAAIFDPFEQGGSSVARQFGGTGLGLSISKRLAVGLGGDIKATSEEGKGASFTVKIKAIPTENNEMLMSSQEMWKVQELPLEDTAIPDFSGNRVLLVDDHPNNRDLIKIILKRMNVEVEEADDGDIALQKVFESEFDVILMDIQMPRMKGDEATEKLRQQGHNLPIIALTANNMKHEIEDYMRKGFNGHLAKPIVRNDFISTLSQYLNAKGSTDSLFSNDEMFDLVAGYHADLPAQVSHTEKMWAAHNIEEFIEITHKIKGAAGSFGFAALGDKFAELEQLAKDNDLAKLKLLMPEVMKYSHLCCSISGIDIPRGVVNFDMNVDFLLIEIQQFADNVSGDLELLTGCVGRGENNIALLYLNRITSKAKKLAWLDLHKMSLQLEKQIKNGDKSASENQEVAQLISDEITRVKALFE